MCGRYVLKEEPISGLDVEILNRTRGGAEIRPGMDAPVVVEPEGSALTSMRWGFEREQGGLVINARVETISEKPMFRGLVRDQRCAMPATGYFEWRRTDRQKFLIDLIDADLFWLAGLWRNGRAGREFVVLTQPPVAAIEPVHNRMPMILPNRNALARWFGGDVPLFSESPRIRLAAEGPEQMQMVF